MSAPGAPPREGLLDLDPVQTEERVVALGGRSFHARVARAKILSGAVSSYAELTSLPALLRERLASELPILRGRELARKVAPDGAVKLVIAFEDGVAVESVYIPSRTPERGATLCGSTQAGCPVGCPFCASGRAGLARNLTAGEILEQYLRGLALGPLSRSVVMGVGEPLLNLENLLGALHSVRTEIGLGARRITVSTVGFPERVRRLAERDPHFQLAISLHTPDDAERDLLVPAMQGVPIEEVLAAGDAWFRATGREVTYEYVLLGGRNDTRGHAERLAARLAGRRATVNLIPYNPIGEEEWRRPERRSVDAFRDALVERSIVATVRWSRGVEGDAACGQLRLQKV